MSAISLNIKNNNLYLFAKLFNILNFNPKKLNIQKEGTDEIGIYYIDYDKNPFYLVIDDLKGYLEEHDDNKYLTMIFTSISQKMMYTKIWEEMKKVINKVADNKLGDFSKDYSVIMFDSDDVLPLNSMINIRALTIIIKSVLSKDNNFYPQIYLNYCSYKLT